MRVQQACRLAFGDDEAEDLGFLRRIRDLLKGRGIDSSTAEAKRVAENCIEVRGNESSKYVYVFRDGRLLHVSDNPPRKRKVAHGPVSRSPNDYG